MQIDEIEQIAGVEKTVRVRNHDIIVREITMLHMGGFTKICAPFLSAFDEAGDLFAAAGKPQSEYALFELLAAHCDAFMQAAAMVSNAPVEFYQKLRPDEFFEVAAAVVEVNGSFFVRRLLPAVIKLAQGIQAVGSSTGSILSGNSLAQATATAPPSLTTPTAPSLASAVH
jgi:hypothetical protein